MHPEPHHHAPHTVGGETIEDVVFGLVVGKFVEKEPIAAARSRADTGTEIEAPADHFVESA